MSENHERAEPSWRSVRPGRDGYVAGRDMTIHMHPMVHGEEQDERAVQARAERAEAFTELWKVAQGAHIGMRNDFDRADELSDVHRRINTLLIERTPALAESDADLARDFLAAVSEFIRLLRPLPGASAERLREEIALTAARPSMLSDFEVLEESHYRMMHYNDLLARRYRELVYGETAPDCP